MSLMRIQYPFANLKNDPSEIKSANQHWKRKAPCTGGTF
jgi:hypothetical protein